MEPEIQQKIMLLLDKMHEEDPLRGIQGQAARLIEELQSKKRYELRQGFVVDSMSKRKVDLAGDVKMIVDSAYYVQRSRNAASDAAYVAPWSAPSSTAKQAAAGEMKKILQKLLKIHSIKPIDEQAMDRAIDIVSKNFLFEFDENGDPSFAKLNDSGLIGQQRFDFKSLIPQHLIDHESTSLAQSLRRAELRSVAKKMIEVDNPKPAFVDDKINQLRKQELKSELPARRLPAQAPGVVEREFIRREAAILGIDPTSGGTPGSRLRNTARSEMEKLDDLNEVYSQLNNINPTPFTGWEGVPSI